VVTVKRLALLAMGGLALTFLLGRLLSRHWLFPGGELRSAVDSLDARRHELRARDGTIVHALELAARDGYPIIVDFHNNRETVEDRLTLARAIHARGFGMLLVEYRGYGRSHGSAATEEGLYLDAEAALNMLAGRGVPTEKIVLWGTSLGTGVAAEMARRGRGAKLVLVSPYTSIPDLVTSVVPVAPARLLLTDHFDTLSKSGQIQIPTVVVHGDADEIVPFWMGKAIAGAIRGARLVRVPGGHHGDLFLRDGERLLEELLGSGA
jgi:fermentation-respiration switch protein FrsA (DUF1100 family)